MGGFVLVILSLISLEYCYGACPSGWTSHDFSCYLFFHELYTFFEAKVTCDIAEAYLVEIDSESENLFVKTMANNNRATNVWMGLEDFIVEGEYQWTSSRTRPEYTNWMAGDPNNWRYQEDCVAMEAANGTWFDFDCEENYAFVCETPREEEIIG